MGRAPKKPKPLIGPGQCTLCPRHQGVRTVCMAGTGPRDPSLIVVGEAPAGSEDTFCQTCQRPSVSSCEKKQHTIGMPFCGPSGQLLRKALLDAAIDPQQVFFTNIVRCGNAASGNPTMAQTRRCRHYCIDELQTLDYSHCRGIMLFGQTAVRGVLNNGVLTIKDARLRQLNSFGPSLPVPLYSTYHPAAALPGRNPALYEEIVEDLRSVWAQRDALKPVRLCATLTDLQVLNSASVIGLDLEWWRDGRIRATGLSTGSVNVVCPTPEPILDWISQSVKKGATEHDPESEVPGLRPEFYGHAIEIAKAALRGEETG